MRVAWISRAGPILLVVSCLVASVLGVLALSRSKQGVRGLEIPAPPAPAEASAADRSVREPIPVAPQSEPETVASTLEEYWGERWPEIRQKLEDEGRDLNAPFHLVPWEEVCDSIATGLTEIPAETKEKMAKGYVDWPEPLTYEWLVDNFGVPSSFTPSDVHEAEAIVQQVNTELDSVARDYVDQLELAMKWCWGRGKIVKAPFCTTGAPSPFGEETFFSKSLASGTGWTVTVALERSEFPDLLEVRDRMKGLRRQREGSLNKFFFERSQH